MKKIYTIFALTLITFLSAQTKFGVNAGTLFMDGRVEIQNNVSHATTNAYYGGLFAEFPVAEKNFNLVVAANYANNEGDNYVYAPIYLKAYVFPRFNLQVGTSLLTFLGKKTDDMNRLNLALTAGIGIDITTHLMLDARYNYQTNDYYKDASRANSVTINYFNMGLGYRF